MIEDCPSYDYIVGRGESINKKLCWLVTWRGYEPAMTVSVTIPFG